MDNDTYIKDAKRMAAMLDKFADFMDSKETK